MRNDARRSRIPDGRIFLGACVEPVQNISGVSIVTPRERNDSAFLREKCRPGIFLPGLAREGRRGDVEQKPERNEDEGRTERNPRRRERARKRRGERDPRNSASHVATVATYSRSLARARARARVYVCIYRDWRIVGRSERGRKMKKRDEIESRARIGVIGVKRAALAWSRSRRVPW